VRTKRDWIRNNNNLSQQTADVLILIGKKLGNIKIIYNLNY